MNTYERQARVKFCDLAAASLRNRQELLDAFTRVLDSGWYVLGRELAAFEEEFARFVGSPHAVGVANGTDAIEISLRALGVGVGDTVFTVSHTAVATVAAIERSGASPAFVDIDPDTFTLAPDSLAKLLTELPPGVKPKAIIPVHLYGQMADMSAITNIAQKYGLVTIEDCAQAHGASIQDCSAGTLGDLGAFSFYPTKNLGAFGDGGGVTVRDPNLWRRLLRLRQYGWEQRFISEEPGINSRLDELQASLLRSSLSRLRENNCRRQEIASHYDEALSCVVDPCRPVVRGGANHVYHLYVVKSRNREKLISHLDDFGIDSAIHYPVPIHLQPAYRNRNLLKPPDGLPVTESVCGQILSLPLYPEMPQIEIERVCSALREYAAKES